jgi:signal transduction histidine kinase
LLVSVAADQICQNKQMKEVVFNQSPVLDSKDKRIADLHSIFNILNVLAGELTILGFKLDGDQAEKFVALENEMASIVDEISENDDFGHALIRIRGFESEVVGAVRSLIEDLTDTDRKHEVSQSLANIESVYNIVHKRLDELDARAGNPDLWVSISAKEFECQLRDVFYAIEKNAKGRYRIFFNLARRNTGDYYIDLKIESALEMGMLWIPLRFIDVIRDLTANARKYTEPGGKVALAIYQSQEEIHVLVEDNGCGIPEGEIERVVEFGYRASNVRDRATMGGGFGLTKAAWLANCWGGTLVISSEVGKGTTVSLTLPNRHYDIGEGSSATSLRHVP